MESKLEQIEPKIKDKLELESFNIETERLLLRPLSLEYADEIFKEFDDEITRYMSPPTPNTILDTKKYIEGSIEGFLGGKEIVIAILKKGTL